MKIGERAVAVRLASTTSRYRLCTNAKLQLIDVQLFADAVAPHHAQADAVTLRGVAGTHGLVALAHTVAPA